MNLKDYRISIHPSQYLYHLFQQKQSLVLRPRPRFYSGDSVHVSSKDPGPFQVQSWNQQTNPATESKSFFENN